MEQQGQTELSSEQIVIEVKQEDFGETEEITKPFPNGTSTGIQKKYIIRFSALGMEITKMNTSHKPIILC